MYEILNFSRRVRSYGTFLMGSAILPCCYKLVTFDHAQAQDKGTILCSVLHGRMFGSRLRSSFYYAIFEVHDLV